jgi:hypothetical protein
MIPNIDRSKHDHGLHNVAERHDDAALRGYNDRTPHNETDLLAVHAAELIPSRTDGSLQGDVTRTVQYQKSEGGESMTGPRYRWDGELLATLFTKP